MARQKFTLKERDNETGLDYFGARYYSSIQGRFASPDKPFADQYQSNPQSWNLFSYVQNNPLRFIDPLGEWHYDAIGKPVGDYDGECSDDGKSCWDEKKQTWDKGVDKTPAQVIFDPASLDLVGNMVMGNLEAGIPASGGLRELSGTRNLFSRLGSFIKGLLRGGAGQAAEFAGGLTRAAIQAAATDPGPTVRVVARLTQAPGAGRALSAATGEGAEALANVAREGGQVYTARIPKALIETLKSADL